MKNYAICLFEDSNVRYFGPLVDTRPVWELRCGARTLGEKVALKFSSVQVYFKTRKILNPVYTELNKFPSLPEQIKTEQLVFINGRARLTAELVEFITRSGSDQACVQDGFPVVIKVRGDQAHKVSWTQEGILDVTCLSHFNQLEVRDCLYNFPWNLVSAAATEISSDLQHELDLDPVTESPGPDFALLRNAQNVLTRGELNCSPGVIIDAEGAIVMLGQHCTLGPGAILDARQGPVWIDDFAEVKAGAILIGPVYVGRHSIVRPGARLAEGVCLGEHCRVGGEVTNTIMIGYSSKQHSGYLGTSYVGEWVNFGAATDNSDLKNNYKPVDVMLSGEKIDSQDLHVGVMIADHCKTAIQTRLNSGTVAGVCCNLFGPDFPAKNIPAFTWHGPDGYQEYQIEKALQTVAAVMPRRGQRLTPALETLLREIFTHTAEERQDF